MNTTIKKVLNTLKHMFGNRYIDLTEYTNKNGVIAFY